MVSTIKIQNSDVDEGDIAIFVKYCKFYKHCFEIIRAIEFYNSFIPCTHTVDHKHKLNKTYSL